MGFKDAFRSKEKKQRLAERVSLQTEVAYYRDVLSRTSAPPDLLDSKASNVELAREVERLKSKLVEDGMKAAQEDVNRKFEILGQQHTASTEKLNTSLRTEIDAIRAATNSTIEEDREAHAFQRANEAADLILKRKIELGDHTSKIENQTRSFALKSSRLTILSVVLGGTVLIIVIREITKFAVTSLQIVSETVMSPRFTKSAVTVVLVMGAVSIVGYLAKAHSIHSNNARSIAEKTIEAQRDLENTRMQIAGGKVPLAIEYQVPKPSPGEITSARRKLEQGRETIGTMVMQHFEKHIWPHDPNGPRSLHHTVEAGDFTLLHARLNSTFSHSQDLRDNRGFTPLLVAVMSNPPGGLLAKSKVIDVLLESHASVNATDKLGRTALHYAVDPSNPGNLKPQAEMLAYQLLAASTSTRIRDFMGNTPLHLAMYRTDAVSLEIVQHLLVSHADPREKNLEGNSAIALAQSRPEHLSMLMSFAK